MHFWIDKPAGRYYGFSGRRYPIVSFPKTHFPAHHHRCGNVTPIHRYAPNSSNSGSSAGPSTYHCPRLRDGMSRGGPDNRGSSNHGQMQHGASVHGNNNLGISSLPQSSTPGSGGLMNFSEFSDAEITGCKLKCSLWFIFLLATSFVAAAKFYFDHQGGLEALVLSGLLLILLISGCFYSIFCRSTSGNQPEEQNPPNPITAVTISNTVPSENVRHVSIQTQQNPPPPYHLAILIPPPTSQDEAPPPSYDKIMQ